MPPKREKKPLTPPNDLNDPDFPARFFARGQMDENGCLVWTGKKKPTGHGRIKVNGHWTTAQRVAWQIVNGPIPEGMYTTHLCGNPSCIRASHLTLMTQEEYDRRFLTKPE
jgi:hypothetical protein